MREWRHNSAYSYHTALDGGEWSASLTSCFCPGERATMYTWAARDDVDATWSLF